MNPTLIIIGWALSVFAILAVSIGAIWSIRAIRGIRDHVRVKNSELLWSVGEWRQQVRKLAENAVEESRIAQLKADSASAEASYASVSVDNARKLMQKTRAWVMDIEADVEDILEVLTEPSELTAAEILKRADAAFAIGSHASFEAASARMDAVKTRKNLDGVLAALVLYFDAQIDGHSQAGVFDLQGGGALSVGREEERREGSAGAISVGLDGDDSLTKVGVHELRNLLLRHSSSPIRSRPGVAPPDVPAMTVQETTDTGSPGVGGGGAGGGVTEGVESSAPPGSTPTS